MEIPNMEERVVRIINGLHTRFYQVVHLVGPNRATEIGWALEEPVVTLLEFQQLMAEMGFEPMEAIDIIEWATELVVQKEEKKREEKRSRAERSAANRAKYLPAPILRYYTYEDNKTGVTFDRWHGDMALRAGGLMALAVDHIWGEQAVPVVVNLINALGEDDDGRRKKVPSDVWDTCNDNQMAVSGGRLGWSMNTPAWNWLKNLFPSAIDLSPYNHGLNAPLLPEGFHPNIRVRFTTLKDTNGVDLQTDGSGWYHPETPELQQFVQKYGLVPIQIRYISKKNVFGKGMLFPTEYSVDDDGSPCVSMDWRQVKGRWKSLAADCRSNDKTSYDVGFLGIIQTWTRKGYLRACFELPENLTVNKESCTIIREQVDKAMQFLQKGGIDKLVGEVARNDDQIALMVQMVTMMKASGADIEATQIPRIRQAVADKLGHKLYHIATAAGIEFPRYVCRMDTTIPPGSCIIPGIKPGTKVVGFRFPMVLAQGMVTLTTMEAPPHLLCNGEYVKETVVLNPQDLVTRMQGDDDGDIAGFSADPDMVKLWAHVDEDRVFHIEPEGEKRTIQSSAEEGLEYLRYDQRGPVGVNTRHRSRLKAVGANMAANGMSIAIQEAIDRAKKVINWSDYRAASDLSNWEQDEAGEYHFSMRLGTGQEEFDGQACWAWVEDQLQQAAGISMQQALGWAWRGKRIDPETWCTTDAKTGWEGGNMVHYIHNYAHGLFEQMKSEFRLDANPLEAEMLLPLLVLHKGINIDFNWPTEEEYERGLRIHNGFVKYGKAMRKAMSFDNSLRDEEENSRAMASERQRLIDDATWELNSALKELTIEEIVTTWVMECRRGQLNNAFRTICWPNSPVMSLLGIREPEACKYLEEPTISCTGEVVTRERELVELCMQQPEPHQTLSYIIYHDEEHYKEVLDEEGNPITFAQCHHCRTQLADNVIREIRQVKARTERKYFSYIVPKLNKK